MHYAPLVVSGLRQFIVGPLSDLYGAVMSKPRWIAAAAIAAAFGVALAGCSDTASPEQPRALGAPAASTTATSSPSATPSPSPLPKPTTKPSVKPPAPKPSSKPPTPKASATHNHSGNVVPGAYCASSEHYWFGRSAAGNLYQCSYYASDGRWHWKRV